MEVLPSLDTATRLHRNRYVYFRYLQQYRDHHIKGGVVEPLPHSFLRVSTQTGRVQTCSNTPLPHSFLPISAQREREQ